MAATGDVTFNQDGVGNVKLHPYLVALVRWCMECLWSSATLVLHRLTTPLPLKPAPKPAKRPASSDHLDPEPRVECQVLHQPNIHSLDVIFVHGLYGSLGNTWRQGEWSTKYQRPETVHLSRPTSLLRPCDCRECAKNNSCSIEETQKNTEVKIDEGNARNNGKTCCEENIIANSEIYEVNEMVDIISDHRNNELTNHDGNSDNDNYTNIDEAFYRDMKKILPKDEVFITENFYSDTVLDQIEIVDNYESQAKFVSDLFKKSCDTNCDGERPIIFKSENYDSQIYYGDKESYKDQAIIDVAFKESDIYDNQNETENDHMYKTSDNDFNNRNIDMRCEYSVNITDNEKLYKTNNNDYNNIDNNTNDIRCECHYSKTKNGKSHKSHNDDDNKSNDVQCESNENETENDNSNRNTKNDIKDNIRCRCKENTKTNPVLCDCKRNDTKQCEVGCGCICDSCYSLCWPRDWIRVDFPEARVISVNYTSDPHLWRPLWIKENKRLRLHERADQMTQQLLELGVGERPVIWVGHSKGGLFIKQIYCEAYEAYLKTRSQPPVEQNMTKDAEMNIVQDSGSNDTDLRISRLWSNSRGFMFYSVPHRGASLADIKTPLTARSVELQEISKDCSLVLLLQERWLRAASSPCPSGHQPLVRSLVETRRTLMSVLWLTIVSAHSADPGIGPLCGVSVDHREICKPTSRHCTLYTELTALIRSALERVC